MERKRERDGERNEADKLNQVKKKQISNNEAPYNE